MGLASPRIWILALNDLESLEIHKLLCDRDETTVASRQRWGASWTGLEPECRAAIASFLSQHAAATVYGIELAGPNPFSAIDIDHHRYQHEDRFHPLSSLEQVAALLNHPLSRWQTLVAANDRGYLPALEALGASPDEIQQVRRADRAAQGVTEDDELRARRDIRHATHRNGIVIVSCPEGFTSAHSDLLYPAHEILLQGPTTWAYYGPRHFSLAALNLPEPHWSGGAPDRGYFGIAQPKPQSQDTVLSFLGLK